MRSLVLTTTPCKLAGVLAFVCLTSLGSAQLKYRIIEGNGKSFQSFAPSINNSGQTASTYVNAKDGMIHVLIEDRSGTVHDLGSPITSLPKTDNYAVVSSIDDSGRVAGYVNYIGKNYPQTTRMPWIYSDKKYRYLDVPQEDVWNVAGMTNDGRVAVNGLYLGMGCISTESSWILVNQTIKGAGTHVSAINSFGDFCGWKGAVSGEGVIRVPFVSIGRRVTQIGLPYEQTFNPSALDANGNCVGTITQVNSSNDLAALFSFPVFGSPTLLGSLQHSLPKQQMFPVGMNSSGLIVGTGLVGLASNGGPIDHVFIWRKGILSDLNTIARMHGHVASEALAVNDNGEVLVVDDTTNTYIVITVPL